MWIKTTTNSLVTYRLADSLFVVALAHAENVVKLLRIRRSAAATATTAAMAVAWEAATAERIATEEHLLC